MVGTRRGVTPGGLLTGERLRSVLAAGERVFVEGSWSEANVRGAGYDLRMATDLMVIPDGPGAQSFTAYERGQHRAGDVLLAPGDTALFSSRERFSFDFDVCGNIGAKFSLAAKGLLILTGLAVDPGYGREPALDGRWRPMGDQRLHFLVANVGPSPVALRPGQDTVAFLQLFEIPPIRDRQPVRSRGFETLQDQLFAGDAGARGGLAYFRNVRDAQRAVERLDLTVDQLRTDVEKVQNATNYVVVFGVFLVAITLLGVLANFLVQTLASLPSETTGWRSVAAYAVAGVYSVAVVVMTVSAVRRTSARTRK
jgi:deoxycytidine triphosphate deaminase